MKFTIRLKLILSFAAVILLLIATGVVSIVEMNSMGNKATEVKDSYMPSVVALGQIRKNLLDTRGWVIRYAVEDNAAGKEDAKKAIDANLNAQKDMEKIYEATITSAEERSLYEEYKNNWNSYVGQIPTILEASSSGKSASEVNALLDKSLVDLGKASDALDKDVDLNNNGATTSIESAVNSYKAGRTIVMILVILAAIVAAVLALVIAQSIANSAQKLVTALQKIASGDMREHVEIRTKDEMGELASSLNEMTGKLRSLIGQIMSSSQSLAAASEQISASSEEIAGGTTTQASAAQTINELFKDLSRAIESVAKSAETASELSGNTRRGAEQGGRVVQASMDGIQKLNKQMSLLKEDSNKIGDIIEVIDEIAEQTNLLALNAAIEAARAGEQGRGFAVVAEEVRKLAERSSSATKEIGLIIGGMQENTQNSVKALADTVEMSQQTGEALDSIIGKVNETAQQVSEIAAASEEQAAQSSEVLSAIEAIASASEEAAAAAEETASSSQSLAMLAEDLNRSVSLFKI
ncbi:methyl-accepting chemotaxis protein [Paenibacillus hexagrammi]|uniref:Methyl-accepting chemotaxis protein n=1 Tax=Paenibacillus hexagrammi TaxID=2908839 RepID=A0ABY3SI31_9BACL|nr:methyl-accepting chemotaxis protein [Paenibacillus sp. YPD9-1]UJF32886.1 methyl-accepting chemotaxis protein [Paenibacillus sp. YPD9-1]